MKKAFKVLALGITLGSLVYLKKDALLAKKKACLNVLTDLKKSSRNLKDSSAKVLDNFIKLNNEALKTSEVLMELAQDFAKYSTQIEPILTRLEEKNKF